LGEYAGNKYDKGALVSAVNLSIRKITVNEGGYMRFDRLQLIKAIADAGFHPNTLNAVEQSVEEEAIKMIDNMTEVKGGQQKFLVNNGHHGRQYIAATVSENIAKIIVSHSFG
jgi:ribosome maturation protein Sdo1